MKSILIKLGVILSYLILCFIFITDNKPIDAAGLCDKVLQFAILPSTGDTNTSFNFQGTINNCANQSNPSRFGLVFTSSGQNPFGVDITTDANGFFNTNVGSFPAAATWAISIKYNTYQDVPFSSPQFLTITAAGPPPYQWCVDHHAVASQGSICPPQCPPAWDPATSRWLCGGAASNGTNPPPALEIGTGQPCAFAGVASSGVLTAIGCIPNSPNNFIGYFIKYISGFAGGIALLLMISGSIQMMTSAGNPEALKSGQERFTSAVIGLIFIILAVTLLEIIGLDILQIPGISR